MIVQHNNSTHRINVYRIIGNSGENKLSLELKEKNETKRVQFYKDK